MTPTEVNFQAHVAVTEEGEVHPLEDLLGPNREITSGDGWETAESALAARRALGVAPSLGNSIWKGLSRPEAMGRIAGKIGFIKLLFSHGGDLDLNVSDPNALAQDVKNDLIKGAEIVCGECPLRNRCKSKFNPEERKFPLGDELHKMVKRERDKFIARLRWRRYADKVCGTVLREMIQK